VKRFFLLISAFVTLRASALDLTDPKALVQAALERAPSLSRIRAAADAAREGVVPAGALPDPMLMGGVQNKMTDLSDDEMMTMYMVGASQTFVRPEKRAARRELAEIATRGVESELATARAEIERDVLLAWYDIAAADAQIETITQVGEMADAVIAAARVRYEVGSAAQADVIRAQLQRASLDQEALRLSGARSAAVARLLPLVGMPAGTIVPAVRIPEGTQDLAADAPAVPQADHPALVALEVQIAAADAAAKLARLDAKPDIDLEAQYGYRRTQRDMFSITARIPLPLRRDQTIEPRVREALARREEAQHAVDELRLALTRAMGEAVAAHAVATKQLELYDAVLVPQARLAFDSTLAAYQTGKAPFDAILTTETDYLRLRLQYFDFLAQHAQAVVTYEALQRGARSGSVAPAAPMSAVSTSATQSSSMGGM
jgi:cobalt-zinc-cadmium efflux system outer membrane protein